MGCKALKARLLLTRASELNDKALYEQAYTLAKEVIDNGPFELSKDFASVFDMENSDGNGNKEVIGILIILLPISCIIRKWIMILFVQGVTILI